MDFSDSLVEEYTQVHKVQKCERSNKTEIGKLVIRADALVEKQRMFFLLRNADIAVWTMR